MKKQVIITVDTNSNYAPGCYLICRCTGQKGHYDWCTTDENNTVLIQSDYEFIGLAELFGCTINYYNINFDKQIAQAIKYLDRLINGVSDKRFIVDEYYFVE